MDNGENGEEAGAQIDRSQETGEGGGVRISRPDSEIAPPLTGDETTPGPELPPGREVGEEVTWREKLKKKVPLKAEVVTPALQAEGMILSHITGYPEWEYTPEQLESIGQLIEACELEASPMAQLILGLAGIHGTKFAAMMIWNKQGRPGDLKRKQAGEKPAEDKPGEEVKT